MLKTPMNLQDTFLNYVRKEKIVVTIHLLNGHTLSGTIHGFDNFAIFLKHKGQELVYKHAIATIVPQREVNQFREVDRVERGFTTEPRIKAVKEKEESPAQLHQEPAASQEKDPKRG